MVLTTSNIDAFIRAAVAQGCREMAWNEQDWNTLQEFATGLGWPPPQKSGDLYMGVKHYLVEVHDGTFWHNA